MKRGLAIAGIATLLGGLVGMTQAFTNRTKGTVCTKLEVRLMNQNELDLVKPEQVVSFLKERGMYPVGLPLSAIDFRQVEQEVQGHRLIARAECFASPSGEVHLHVWQHIPILRIIQPDEDYYIDEEGEKAGLSDLTAADVVVATGAIHDKRTVHQLYELVKKLKNDAFAEALIEQIHVGQQGEWVLIPRMGNLEILWGKPVQSEEKLTKMVIFMRDYLPRIGFDTYSSINLAFNNQIIGIKKQNEHERY
jgi:cell division protein FtsQ